MTVITDDLPAQLIHQEREGWEALLEGEGGTFFHRAMIPEAIMIVEGDLFDRGAIIVALQGSTWDSYTLSEQRVIRLGERAAILAYRVTGERDGERVDLHATTTYVYQEGRWRVGAHQQTRAEI